MKPIAAIAKQAYTSILGAIGHGAGGGETSNNLSQINAGAVGPSANPEWDSSSFVSATGRVLVMGYANVSAGTLAVGDAVTGNIQLDGAGGSNVSANWVADADVAGGVVNATVYGMMIVSVTPGVSHTFGIKAAIGGGHTATIPISGANITVIDV